MKHLLRIEGVNLSRFVFDTRDLSTIRGASLLLLDAIPEVEAELRTALGKVNVRVLSQGASIGVFSIEAPAVEDAALAAQRVRSFLRHDARFRHATFVVDVLPEGDTSHFRPAMEFALAANRWRQLQAATLSAPTANQGSITDKPACGLDGLRPANHSPQRKVRDLAVSETTWQRREYGCNQKQPFYRKATGLGSLPRFAEDFEHIAEGIRPLDGKLAVFYADGNQFGKLQTLHCTTPAHQALWDHFIRSSREAFLKSFIETCILPKGSRWLNGEGHARFETLLWGGDELMFVMPASLGWSFANFFFQELGGMNLQAATLPTDHPFVQDKPQFPAQPLTHTAALVFCQHHAPIDRIKRLAKDQMTEYAKGLEDAAKNPIGRSRNQLVCVALESFDHLGSGYKTAMNLRYQGALPLEHTILHDDGAAKPLAKTLASLADGVAKLKSADSDFARSQLRHLVASMLEAASKEKGKGTAAQFQAAAALAGTAVELPDAFRNAKPAAKDVLTRQLLPLFQTPTALWITLEELWDYALL